MTERRLRIGMWPSLVRTRRTANIEEDLNTMSVNMDRPAEPPGKDALDFAEALAPNIDAAVGWLVSEQKGDGHWCAELEGDTILESEYVLLMAYLGRHRTSDCTEACKYMLTRQNDEGGWAIYPGGPSELSATVKAYYALKLTGLSTDDPRMVKARNWILRDRKSVV